MSRSLLDVLADELRLLLSPLLAAAVDEDARERLLEAVGADPSLVGGDALVSALRALVDLAQRVDQLATNPGDSMAGVAALLQAAGDVHTAVRALGHTGGAAYEGLGADLLTLLTGAYLRADHPLVFSIATLLGLVEPQVAPSLGDGARVTRHAYGFNRVRFDRLSPLLNDPVGALRTEYFANRLASVADANASADTLFPRVVQLLSDLGVTSAYGLPDGDRALLGDAAALIDHALVIYAPRELIGDDVESGLALTFSSADRGDLGLVVSPFGALTLSRQVASWKLDLVLTGDVQAFAVGRHGPTLAASAGSADLQARFGASLVHDDSAPAFVLGAPNGTRIELGGAELGAALGLAARTAALTMAVSSGRLVIGPGDGDGFLQYVLPPSGVSVAFDLGLSLSSQRGFELSGGVGLQAVLPAHVSLGSIGSIDSVQLALAAHDDGLQADVSCAVTVHLGPVDVSIDGIGVRAATSFAAGGGNLGLVDLAFGFKASTQLGLAVDSGPVTGGGFLAFDPDRGEYAGEVQLHFEGIAVRAIGLLTTHLPGGQPGFSLLVIVSAEFPPLELGLGFLLVGVGGLLGINRTVAVEALRAGLKTGALGAVLSPPDPKANVGQLVATLAGLFPPAAGRHIFAPTARIVWGSPTQITIDLCLVLELPSPVRLVALGRLRAVLPDEREAIVRIQVDVLGVIDFDRSQAAVDATLVDSRLAQFALTGDMALRMSWGAQPSFLLAVGGFHPRFAAPPGFPALERVAVALASGDNPKLRLEAYFALTSNTVQFGARVDLAARAGSFSIAGFLSFDALVTLAPFGFVVDIAAKLAVKVGGHTLLSVSLALTLSGPRPWRARGRASFSILFFDVSFGFDITIGDDAPPVLPSPVDVGPLLLAAFADARAWSAPLPAGGAALVTLRAIEPGADVLAHPLATLQVRQRVAPLERTLDRFGASVPSGANRFTITLATIGGVRTTLTGLQDRFAPAQFTALSDDARLSAPSFEEMTSGAALGADGFLTGAAISVSVVYEQLLVTALGVAAPMPQRVAIPGDVFVTLTAPLPDQPPAFAMRAAA